MRAEASGLPPAQLLRALTAALAAVYGLWILRHGMQTGSDTQSYSEWADLMIAHRFNIASYLREHSFVVPPVLYLAWILVVAALKIVLGGWWMQGVVALNWCCFTAGAYAALSWIRRATASSSALLMAAALLLVAADLLIFVPFVLSDLSFWGLSTTVIVMALYVAAADDLDNTARRVVIGTLLAALAMMFRPVALPLAVFWIAAIIVRLQRERVVRLAPLLMGALCGLVLLTIAAHAYVLMNPAAWPGGRLPAMFELLSREYREGVLVYSPDNNFIVSPATDWLGFIRITLEKWVYFWTPWLPHYSAAHTVMNLAFFGPVYFLSAVALRHSRRLSPSQYIAAWMLGVVALLVSSFHAMVQIDYDHRYRLPLLPVLMMLAALGLEAMRRPPLFVSHSRH
jgi:hypothetical protein